MHTAPLHTLEIALHGFRVHLIQSGAGAPVLFLHGASFQAQTWVDTGILQAVARAGYCAFAVDLPGHGQSESCPHDRQTWLGELLQTLDMERPFVVSPSMSGSYSLPLAAANPQQLAGLVAVAPVRVSSYAPRLQNQPLPLLACWGENDRTIPIDDAHALIAGRPERKLLVLPGAGHACYMNQPQAFTQAILDFFQQA